MHLHQVNYLYVKTNSVINPNSDILLELYIKPKQSKGCYQSCLHIYHCVIPTNDRSIMRCKDDILSWMWWLISSSSLIFLKEGQIQFLKTSDSHIINSYQVNCMDKTSSAHWSQLISALSTSASITVCSFQVSILISVQKESSLRISPPPPLCSVGNTPHQK